MVPQACATPALCLLYPSSKINEVRRPENAAKAPHQPPPPPNLFFVQQCNGIGNACGTIACMHAVAKKKHGLLAPSQVAKRLRLPRAVLSKRLSRAPMRRRLPTRAKGPLRMHAVATIAGPLAESGALKAVEGADLQSAATSSFRQRVRATPPLPPARPRAREPTTRKASISLPLFHLTACCSNSTDATLITARYRCRPRRYHGATSPETFLSDASRSSEKTLWRVTPRASTSTSRRCARSTEVFV